MLSPLSLFPAFIINCELGVNLDPERTQSCKYNPTTVGPQLLVLLIKFKYYLIV